MSKWYCRICNKNLNASPLCMESHFRRKHPRAIPREKMDGGRWNWSCGYERIKEGPLKKWMVVLKKRNCILLHYNEKDLKQYKGLVRVPNWIIKRIKQQRRKK